MGQMIKVMYLGAYLEVNNEHFQNEKVEDSFYEGVGEENFVYPYQGLEELNILIPNKPDYSLQIDLEGEFVINEINTKDLEDKLRIGYADQISKVEDFFPGEVIVKSGLVCYWDEIA